jgi:hypothetical protein
MKDQLYRVLNDEDRKINYGIVMMYGKMVRQMEYNI